MVRSSFIGRRIDVCAVVVHAEQAGYTDGRFAEGQDWPCQDLTSRVIAAMASSIFSWPAASLS